MNSVAAIILAAGKGSRINAQNTNKVLLTLAGKPMIGYTVDILNKLNISTIIVVVGHQKQQVKKYLGNKVEYMTQKRQLGTGHAVMQAMKALPESCSEVIVLYGDHSSFYTPDMLKNIIRSHKQNKADMTFVTVRKKDPAGYGRILRDDKGNLLGIREHKNASPAERKIKEINAGAYCYSLPFLNTYLTEIKKDPIKGEYYLTDLLSIALLNNCRVNPYLINDELISVGVNTLQELALADTIMKKRLPQ